MNPEAIYHVCRREGWEQAGPYRGSFQDLEDGFIHCSAATQLRESVAKHRAASLSRRPGGPVSLALLDRGSTPLDPGSGLQAGILPEQAPRRTVGRA